MADLRRQIERGYIPPMSPFRASLVVSLGVIGTGTLSAQETAKGLESGPIAPASQSGDWTVVTAAPDGRLGVAVAGTAAEAIAQAIRNCTAISGKTIGCGAQSKAVRAGWILAIRCGASSIIVAEPLLRDAQRMAADREAELRRFYAADLPPCRCVLTVDPRGGIGMPGHSDQHQAYICATNPRLPGPGGSASRASPSVAHHGYRRRHSSGETPANFLNARLKAAPDSKPTAVATEATLAPSSASNRLANCMRSSLRYCIGG